MGGLPQLHATSCMIKQVHVWNFMISHDCTSLICRQRDSSSDDDSSAVSAPSPSQEAEKPEDRAPETPKIQVPETPKIPAPETPEIQAPENDADAKAAQEAFEEESEKKYLCLLLIDVQPQ